jgi:hypothetical protein
MGTTERPRDGAWYSDGTALPGMADEYDDVMTRAMAAAADDPRTPQGEMLFWAFVVMRQRAWYRKEVLKAPPPWTADPIINEWRFTNIYRELDRGTLFLAENVLEEQAIPARTLPRMVALYRAFNRIDTWLSLANAYGGMHSLAYAVGTGDVSVVYEFFRAAQARGHKVFTGAYMMTSMAKVFHEGMVERMFVIADEAGRCQDLRCASLKLQEMPYLGAFSAFQIAMDMAIPVARLGGHSVLGQPNLDSYVEVGPGSKTGAREVRADLPALTVMRYLRENQFLRMGVLAGGPFPYPRRDDGQPVTLRMVDVEHALCEYAKYVKALSGGRMKSRLSTRAVGADLWRPSSPVPPGWGGWYRRGNR